MQLLRGVFILVAIGVAAAQYLQERRRLEVIQKLPGPKARELYEEARRRGERAMLAVSAIFAALGAAAVADMLGAFQ